MSYKFSNNYSTKLSADLLSTDTTLYLQDVTGFPAANFAKESVLLTIEDSSKTKLEIVKVTGLTGNECTIERGQEGTTAQDFSIEDEASNRLTAAAINEKLDIDGTAANADKLDNLDSTDFSLATHDHDNDYLGINDKATDSSLLGGQLPSYFATATHNHDSHYLGINDTAADSAKLDGQLPSYFATATHTHDTDEVNEGVNNLYYTDSRAISAIQNDPSWKAVDWDESFSWGDHSLVGYELASNKGTASGYASLDIDGKVPSTQLPSYVYNVLEYTDQTAFPESGESSKIYIAEDTNKVYRWSGTTYVEVSSSDVNSVNGVTGNVVLGTDEINEGDANLYYTATRVNSDIDAKVTQTYINALNIDSATLEGNPASAFATATHSHDGDYLGINATAVNSDKLNGMDASAFATATHSHTTDEVSEGTSNLYYTDTRARASIDVTGDLSYDSATGVISFSESYSTPAEIKTAYESNADTNAFTDAEQTKLSGIEAGAQVNTVLEAPIDSQQYVRQDAEWVVVDIPEKYTTADFNADFTTKSTSDLSEGTNLYFTDSRARDAISISGDLSYDSVSGVISFNETYSSPNKVLDAIKTVDGSGSGLDADLLDGLQSTAFATSAQGDLADSAVQPNDLSTVATSGSYNDLTNKPDLSVLEEVNVYASESSFPATGETDKIYIAEDTGYMYRWNGAGYTQLTDQTAIWGQVSGDLSNQTDLQSALYGKADLSHSHLAADLPDTIMYEGENISLLNNDSAYITSAGAPVQSVNGATGAVSLTTTDVGEGTNLYYTDSRARESISVSGDLLYDSGTGVISFNETYNTASEVKTAYESNADTNAFTDNEKTKLTDIEAEATANSTDTFLLSRTNHTGSQAISTITNLQASLDSKLEDAPSDGGQYVRQDASWVEADPTNPWTVPPESLTITYKTDTERVEQLTETIGSDQRITSYTYNEDGFVATCAVEYLGKRRTETFSYDAEGKLLGITAILEDIV